jgi:D-psicose/D-tagatose/L-ribulose 3-epimerase
MEFGVCTGPENAELCYTAGADFLEAHVQNFLRPADPLWQKPLDPQTLPIPIAAYNCFLPGDLKITGPTVDMNRIKAYAARACKRAREMGSSVIVLGSGAARNIPDGWPRDKGEEQLIEVVRMLGPLARALSLTIALEPLHTGESNILNSVAVGMHYLRQARTAGVTMLADFYHMTLEDEPLDVLDETARLLSHVHVAEPQGRVAPRPGGTDLRPFFAKLKAIGYDKRISLECSWEDLKKQLRPTLDFLHSTWDAA